MKLVVGLGNPGKEYEKTRHNVGFVTVDRLIKNADEQWSTSKKLQSLVISRLPSVVFCKPQTFMNSSGIAVQKVVNFYKVKLADLWVIYDDLDIKIGQYKIQQGHGPKDHNGLNSIYEKLGSKDFWHVRIGIENRLQLGVGKTDGEVYVLQKFTEEEDVILKKTIEKVISEIL